MEWALIPWYLRAKARRRAPRSATCCALSWAGFVPFRLPAVHRDVGLPRRSFVVCRNLLASRQVSIFNLCLILWRHPFPRDAGGLGILGIGKRSESVSFASCCTSAAQGKPSTLDLLMIHRRPSRLRCAVGAWHLSQASMTLPPETGPGRSASFPPSAKSHQVPSGAQGASRVLTSA